MADGLFLNNRLSTGPEHKHGIGQSHGVKTAPPRGHQTVGHSVGARRPKPLREDEREMSPERRLWLGVLRQAIADLEVSDYRFASEGQHRHAKSSAEDWFKHPPRGFFMVCAMAGVDPDVVREAYSEGRLHEISKRMRRHGDELSG